MKNYIIPELEIVSIEFSDIVTASRLNGNDDSPVIKRPAANMAMRIATSDTPVGDPYRSNDPYWSR